MSITAIETDIVIGKGKRHRTFFERMERRGGNISQKNWTALQLDVKFFDELVASKRA